MEDTKIKYVNFTATRPRHAFFATILISAGYFASALPRKNIRVHFAFALGRQYADAMDRRLSPSVNFSTNGRHSMRHPAPDEGAGSIALRCSLFMIVVQIHVNRL
jgi:hypothetical protein